MGHFSTKVQIKHIMALMKVTLSALLAVASAAPNAPAPYAAPHPAPYHEEPVLPPVYNYEYGVQDGYSGAVFSHAENRDNYDTAGEYRVNLPDGRVQIVTYKADANGYTADIKYEGEAHYPEDKEYKPAHPAPYKPAPAPAYKPAPKVYHPAPAPYHPAPAYKPAPVYHPAPAPYHRPRTYSFKPVTEAPAPVPEAKEAEAAPAEAAPAEEPAEVAEAY